MFLPEKKPKTKIENKIKKLLFYQIDILDIEYKTPVTSQFEKLTLLTKNQFLTYL